VSVPVKDGYTAVAASIHDEIVRAERDRIRRELQALRLEAKRIAESRGIDWPMSMYLGGYIDALGDVVTDLEPHA
jgi:hypothetical protein